MPTQKEKAEAFHALHHRQGRAFLIPNPYDPGTARLLALMGFEALATTSAGFAFTRGRPDYTTTREEMLAHAADLVSATSLPVSADLENGYGKTPEEVADTYRRAAAAGLAGASIEDTTNDPANPFYDTPQAVERVQAAVSAVRQLDFPFQLTARTENYLNGKPDLADTIRRLQAFQEAGADVLYAPGITKKEEIAELVRSVDRPVNVLMGLKGAPYSLQDLQELGVTRVSVGSALSRAALGGFLRAAREMLQEGTFHFADEAEPYQDLTQLFASVSQ